MPEDTRNRKKERVLIPYFLITICLIAFDQITKYIAITQLNTGESIPLIKGIFHITLVLNRGIAFGLFKKNLSIPIVIACFVILTVVIFFIGFSRNKKLSTKLGASFILSGCIGNLIDRVRLGAVIDFLDFRIWPVFNIADSAASIGAVLLLLVSLRKIEKPSV